MQLDEIAIQCVNDSLEWFPKHAEDLGYLTIAMAGEVGEFANLIKKGMRGDDVLENPAFEAMMAEELTDVFIYLMGIAGAMGWDMEELYKRKRAINVGRFSRATDRTNGEVQ